MVKTSVSKKTSKAPIGSRKPDELDDITQKMKKSVVSERRFKPSTLRKFDPVGDITERMKKTSISKDREVDKLVNFLSGLSTKDPKKKK